MSTQEKTPLSFEKLKNIAHHILDFSKKQGATDAEVSISNGLGFTTQVRLGEVETLEYHRSKGIGITVYFGQKKGTTSLSAIEETALNEAVSAACHIAKYTSEDNCAGLIEKKFLAFNYPDLKLFYPWSITPEQGIELAKEVENIGRAYDKRISNSEGATLSTHENHFVYANSIGFCGHYSSSFYNLNCTLIANENDRMQRDYGYSIARDPLELFSAKEIAKEAATKVLRRLGAKKLSTRKTPVIFSSNVSPALISHFLAAIRGSNLYRKSSFLCDYLEKPVFPSHIQIREEPFIIKGLASAPFDDEGATPRPRDLIHQGILKSYFLNSYTARKLGMEPTGNAGGIHNILVSHSADTFEELLKKMDTGLVITELMGQGINLVNGDYSRGATGFWVEKGEIQYPVEEITIAGNLKNMFMGILAIGTDIEKRSSIQTGSILIDEMTIAGE
ncbi:MAG: hypothetical protein ACD_44C00029G0002 [uncultured bacterium]|nr:MAG: hypothetical protein ACD_44C00029G0002 [uncultured bacterium]OGT15910.1 MAG: metalloprotease PmbA [Gammaproteobacteria bacterium RIFCSPHIGHO2_02_FULL_38_33]OGT24605.1 MAG: metalloprotease PmbA [Gammaproteobacteria bacterium RIFCSPHIGHO2_12_38_15]OGT69017.1 MAG: metalloprotease PmbA [Gammaproteobacteria bacterium RIFCSPLOWO2_02_FULL_38_11]OGT76375.1 MAG: metalloprotease PmbA [Gammaproteobacteria bacterium RIFCSPLOWO2_12_FULL_38_14]